MPEIQREEILAGRIEEMQKFRDSMQLDMMLGGRVDDDDDDSNRKKSASEPNCQLTSRKTHQRLQRSHEGNDRLEKETKGQGRESDTPSTHL